MAIAMFALMGACAISGVVGELESRAACGDGEACAASRTGDEWAMLQTGVGRAWQAQAPLEAGADDEVVLTEAAAIEDQPGSRFIDFGDGDTWTQQALPTCPDLSSVTEIAGKNVAARDLGSEPFGSASLSGYCSSSAGGEGSSFVASGIHCWKNINDGLLGNSHSWIPGGSGRQFVGVRFAEPRAIIGFRISRRGQGSCCSDRIGGSYTVQYTLAHSPDHETPDSAWAGLGTFSRSSYGFEYFKFCREVHAAAVRIVVTDPSACIDELEIYSELEDPTPSPTPDPTPSPTPALVFHLAPSGAAACDVGLSPAQNDCEAIARRLLAELGKPVSRFSSGNWDHVPSGCIVHNPSSQIGFNHHGAGRGNPLASVVCSEAGCIDVSGSYMHSGGGTATFTQTACSGTASNGGSYTISRSIITLKHGDHRSYTGTVTGPPGSRFIDFGDGDTWTQQAQFAIGDTGANACPSGSSKVTERSRCEAAAQELLTHFLREVSDEYRPGGCYQYRPNGQLYLNRWHGAASHDARPICEA